MPPPPTTTKTIGGLECILHAFSLIDCNLFWQKCVNFFKNQSLIKIGNMISLWVWVSLTKGTMMKPLMKREYKCPIKFFYEHLPLFLSPTLISLYIFFGSSQTPFHLICQTCFKFMTNFASCFLNGINLLKMCSNHRPTC